MEAADGCWVVVVEEDEHQAVTEEDVCPVVTRTLEVEDGTGPL